MIIVEHEGKAMLVVRVGRAGRAFFAVFTSTGNGRRAVYIIPATPSPLCVRPSILEARAVAAALKANYVSVCRVAETVYAGAESVREALIAMKEYGLIDWFEGES